MLAVWSWPQSEKAQTPMLVTPPGILIEVRLLQLLKAELPILSNFELFDMLAVWSRLQFRKAELPILTNCELFDMLAVWSRLQPEKA